MKIIKQELAKFKGKPVKLIGTVLIYIGTVLFAVPPLLVYLLSLLNLSSSIDNVFSNVPLFVPLFGLLLIFIGQFILIISLIIYKELMKEAFKLVGIGCLWLVFSAFGMIGVMLWISLALILIGTILTIVNWVMNKMKHKKNDSA